MYSVVTNEELVKEVFQEPIKFAEDQLKVFWLPEEIKVEKDIQDVLVNMTEAERHGVITTLKLFSLYELKAGSSYWLGEYMRMYSRPEFQRMASVFGMFELAVHKPFYSKLNELLHIDNDEFYHSYVEDETLRERMKMISTILDSKSELVKVAGFSFIEGAILYSNFAFLKHFQSVGKNKLINVVRGINFSVRDENIHSLAGAWTFKTRLAEMNYSQDELDKLEAKILSIAQLTYQHEIRIVDMLFEKGDIEGITATQMYNFIQSRINVCLNQLGYHKIFNVTYNPIAKWFYDGINGFQLNDQFSGVGSQYHRNWDETAFLYKNYNG